MLEDNSICNQIYKDQRDFAVKIVYNANYGNLAISGYILLIPEITVIELDLTDNLKDRKIEEYTNG